MAKHLEIELLWENVEAIRANAPVVHNITNYVVMNSTANALLALGASPIMSAEISEIEELITISSAVVINIGTLEKSTIECMMVAMEIAKDKGKPVVIDPVGVGATTLRKRTVKELLKKGDKNSIVLRGNASEVGALVSDAFTTKGVDSTHSSSDVLSLVQDVLTQVKAVVISGKVDIVADEDNLYYLSNGHALMTKVTGMGCTFSALLGAFCAIEENKLLAALQGAAVMGVVGELVGEQAIGPGDFQRLFYDTLYLLQKADMQTHLKWQDKPYG